MANETVFTRYQKNPIVTASALPTAHTIFNSAAVRFGKRFAGVFRVDTQRVHSQLHVGFSDNGLTWFLRPERITLTSDDPEAVTAGSGYDPRVTPLEGAYYVTWCDYPAGPGPHIRMARTRDFERFDLVGDIVLPYNRNAVLFPRRIGGKYAMLHRPSDQGHTAYGDIFCATSPDLVHWGDHHYVMGPTSGWQSRKIGPGPVPIETPEGWLVIYHGVRITCSGYIYSAGAALLDLEKPWKVLYRTRRYLLAPTTDYERTGDVPNVVFPTAAVVDEGSGDVSLYYGAADTSVCLANAQLAEIIHFVKTNGK